MSTELVYSHTISICTPHSTRMAPVATLSATLNYDVLLNVIALAPHETGTSLMSTCRLLYHEGAKVIIKDPVGLETERRLLSFLSFLHAKDDMIRCTYLRRLDLWTLGLSAASAEALVLSLAHMTTLDTLVITHPELTLASHPALPQSLASLHSLKHHSISHGYTRLQPPSVLASLPSHRPYIHQPQRPG